MCTQTINDKPSRSNARQRMIGHLDSPLDESNTAETQVALTTLENGTRVLLVTSKGEPSENLISKMHAACEGILDEYES